MQTSAPAPDDQPERHRALVRMHIPGDTVNRVTADLPDNQRSLLRWLHNFAVVNNFGTEELAGMLKKEDGKPYSKDSVYQTLTGRRIEAGASLERFCEAIARLKRIEDTRSGTERAPFIETALTRRLWKVFAAALAYQRIVLIYADSQVGKTKNGQEYARKHNHGETIYVRMPTKGNTGDFVRRLLQALRISSRLTIAEAKERILGEKPGGGKTIDDRMLLIVDQCHECFLGGNKSSGVATLLFIMEIFDICNCGIVLMGTGDFEKGMMDPKYAEEMKQIRRRGMPEPIRLPSKPTAENLNDFAAFYKLKPATGEALDLQSEIIARCDLGVWLTLLQAGSRIATKAKGAMTWEHVQKAYAGFVKLSQGGREE